MISALFRKLGSLTQSKSVEPSRCHLLEDLTKISPADAALLEELEGRLERLRAQGVVSISGGVRDKQLETSTRGNLWTLNNVLRQYEEGKGEIKMIGPRQ